MKSNVTEEKAIAGTDVELEERKLESITGGRITNVRIDGTVLGTSGGVPIQVTVTPSK